MKTRALITGTGIAVVLAYATVPTFAQDDGGLRVSLGFQQSFSFGDNLALGVPGSVTNPEQGSTSLSTTAFALNVDSQTSTETFRFQIGGSARYGSTPPGTNVETGFVDPFVSLSYDREGSNARFSFSLDVDESDVSLARPLWTFSDEDNVISPPSDLGDLQGTGTRRSQSARVSLEAGINAPLGFRFSASHTGLRYDNTTTALTESDRDTAALSTFLRFNRTTSAVLDLNWSRFAPRNGTAASTTRSAELGFDHEFANEGTLQFRVGRTDGDTTTSANADGTTGSLRYSHPLPNGALSASYTLRRTDSGEIETMQVGRNFALRSGSLSFNLGTTQINGNSAKPTGSLNWLYEMPRSQLSVQLNRSVSADSNNTDRFTTSLAAQYRQELTALSSISANFSLFVQDGTGASNKVTRKDAALAYQYALTDDWNLDAGVNLRIRDEATVGRATSKQVFVSLSRRFDLR